eukprot:CAMPEP_0203801796 /NCGR_PEP_ID=MMETSP0100_2-20121128/11592_1 /ASSEMBLY_ACC=CAM_ASM_000210 /TAXON_ID=96639 /ORGANISM=" , Strain NY0313808BC1" /LENGTH=70 /DNA_ID=CAMNT_0050708671 /DNA_START=381 /DNA_END=593 /DNA_ORIENTATION=+
MCKSVKNEMICDGGVDYGVAAQVEKDFNSRVEVTRCPNLGKWKGMRSPNDGGVLGMTSPRFTIRQKDAVK